MSETNDLDIRDFLFLKKRTLHVRSRVVSMFQNKYKNLFFIIDWIYIGAHLFRYITGYIL